MANDGNGGGFFEELKRRKVVRAVLAWSGFAVIMKEGTEIAGPLFGMSDGAIRALFFVVLLCLPAFVFFSWAFEVTPEGIRRIAEPHEEPEEEGSEALARRRRMTRKTPGWVTPVTLLALAGLGALYVLDPGGVVSGLREPLKAMLRTGVDVADANFSQVEGGMEIGSSITLEFTGEVDGVTATSENIRLLDSDGEVVPSVVTMGEDGATIIIDPRPTLAYGADYTLRVSEALLDTDGKAVWGREGGPGDTFILHTQPVPAGGARPSADLAEGFNARSAPRRGPVPVRFTQAVDPATVSDSTLRLETDGGDPVEAELSFAEGMTEVRLEPAVALRSGTAYAVRVDSTVATPEGVPVVATSLSFRVAPARRPAQTAATPTTRPTRPAPAQPEPPPPATGPGTLNLSILPAAAVPFVKVVVDGDTVGPPVIGLSLAEERTHTVVVVGVPEFSAYTLPVFRETLRPEPGQVVNLDASITPFGSIDVVSEPAGIVLIDGTEVGSAPLAGYPVTAGVIHSIEIRPRPDDAARFDPFTAEFRVEPLEWKSLGRLNLPPKG